MLNEDGIISITFSKKGSTIVHSADINISEYLTSTTFPDNIVEISANLQHEEVCIDGYIYIHVKPY